MKREELQELAQETIKISTNKSYDFCEKVINFNTEDAYQLFIPSITLDKKPNCEKAVIEIKQESTITAIHRMANDKLGVLNFASAKHPCGGFINGSMAQEECLAYCSNLYDRQWPRAKAYYVENLTKNNPLYSDTMFIDNVVFFRNADFKLIEKPIQCKVLTSAAVNTNIAFKDNFTPAEVNEAMKNRMRKILNCFIVSECSDIILGAFGCGVFGNSAEDVARIWKELLFDENYIYYFNNICFSVLDSGVSKNFNSFIKVFNI